MGTLTALQYILVKSLHSYSKMHLRSLHSVMSLYYNVFQFSRVTVSTTVLLSTVCVTLRWRPEQVLKWSHHRRWSLPAPWVGGFSALVICAPAFHTLPWPFYHTLHFGFGLGEDVFCSALAGWLWKNDDVENRRWRWQVCWWLRIKLLWGHPMLQGTLL